MRGFGTLWLMNEENEEDDIESNCQIPARRIEPR
jgi:hypothetical protein